jgi:hypothetical protein
MVSHVRRHSCGHSGVAFTQSIITKATRLLRLRASGQKLSLQQIADLCGVRDKSTIRRWSLQPMTQYARGMRSSSKGGYKLLSQQQEAIAKGWVYYRNDLYLDTSTERFLSFLSHLKKKAPCKAWLTRFKQRHRLSSRIVQYTAPELINARAYVQGVDFLRRLRVLNIHPSHFLFVDKITFNQPRRTNRQIAPMGRYFVSIFQN